MGRAGKQEGDKGVSVLGRPGSRGIDKTDGYIHALLSRICSFGSRIK